VCFQRQECPQRKLYSEGGGKQVLERATGDVAGADEEGAQPLEARPDDAARDTVGKSRPCLVSTSGTGASMALILGGDDELLWQIDDLMATGKRRVGRGVGG
jgi:hypothetical protein